MYTNPLCFCYLFTHLNIINSVILLHFLFISSNSPSSSRHPFPTNDKESPTILSRKDYSTPKSSLTSFPPCWCTNRRLSNEVLFPYRSPSYKLHEFPITFRHCNLDSLVIPLILLFQSLILFLSISSLDLGIIPIVVDETPLKDF